MLILTILTALARGLREGIVMCQPGPREHVAFWSYHALDCAVLAGIAALAVQIIRRRPRWPFILGLAVAAWEAFEVGYAVSRGLYGYEHIVFADIISVTLTGWHVYALHTARAVAAGILLYFGRSR